MQRIPSKDSLLAKYKKGEINSFGAVYAYNEREGADEIIQEDNGYSLSIFNSGEDNAVDLHTDPEGNSLMFTIDYELTNDCPNVKLLIKPGADKKTIMALLSKITGFVEESYDDFEESIRQAESEVRQKNFQKQ
tara:strand:+ start:83 stop:484 length:402 start_codon:yes stop_codon:yes gene_type:complete